MHQRSGRGRIYHCGGQGRVQTRSGHRNYGSWNGGVLRRPRRRRTTPIRSRSGTKEGNHSAPRHEAGPSREQPWKDIDLTNFELSETPFQRVRAELTHLQNQYWKLEHITCGVSRALGNCGPENILQDVARVTDQSKMDALETEKAQLAA